MLFETPWRLLWRHCNLNPMSAGRVCSRSMANLARLQPPDIQRSCNNLKTITGICGATVTNAMVVIIKNINSYDWGLYHADVVCYFIFNTIYDIYILIVVTTSVKYVWRWFFLSIIRLLMLRKKSMVYCYNDIYTHDLRLSFQIPVRYKTILYSLIW